jgi:hypothetical protein
VDFSSATSLKTIESNAFENNYNLLELDLSQCVALEQIQSYAFYNCNMVGQIKLPQSGSLKIIGEKAFALSKGKADSLQSVDMSSIETLSELGKNAFENRTALQTVAFGKNIEVVQGFSGCTGLQSVIFEKLSAPKKIGVMAFANCTSLKTFDFWEGLEIIDDSAFYGSGLCGNLTLPKSIKYIGDSAFYNCGSMALTSLDLSACTALAAISAFSFYDISSLKALQLPSTIKEIGASAFFGTGIKTLNIPPCVETIQSNAFSDCKNLETVYFEGENSLLLGYAVFQNCISLCSIYFACILPPNFQMPEFGLTNGTAKTQNEEKYILFVPKGAKNNYQKASYYSYYSGKNEFIFASFDQRIIEI